MVSRRTFSHWHLAVTLAAAPGGCAPPPPAPAPHAACPHIPAPPPEAAHIPPAPVSGFRQILRPGHWDWAAYHYSWVPAVWMTLLAPGRPMWRDGYWVANQGACVWQTAHFVMPDDKAGPGY